MKRQRIYISGPVSGLPREEYLSSFAEAERKGIMDGYRVVNPTKIWVCRHILLYSLLERILGKRTTYIIVLMYDLWLLRRCTHIYMLPGWQRSKGARMERREATRRGLKVIEE